MKKYFLWLILSCFVICLGSKEAYAYPSSTDWEPNPSESTGKLYRSPNCESFTYKLQTNSSETITGEKSCVYFDKVNGVGEKFSKEKRNRWIYLREYDKEPDLDEYVKTYVAEMENRVVKKFKLYRTDKAGNIDPKFDRVGEFYIESKVEAKKADKAKDFLGPLFIFKIVIK